MTYSYSRRTDLRRRPYLELTIATDAGPAEIRGLVDSGADVSVLPLPLAMRLGFRPDDLRLERGTQVDGTVELWRAPRPIRCRLSGDDAERYPFELTPTCVEGADIALLGRTDFMAAWSVLIAEIEQSFTIWWNAPGRASWLSTTS